MHLLYQKKNQVLLLLLCSLLFILVIKPWQLYFLNDDFLHIPMPNKWLFLRGGFMRPVPNFVLLWDKWLYGSKALGFFFTTIFFHIACVFSVYFFVAQILKTYLPQLADSLIAFTAAMFFLCYPYHAESIMWVISRVSIMAAMLTFLSLLFYIKAAKNDGWLLLSWLCFVIALFTYESMWNIMLLFAIISFVDVCSKRTTITKSVMMYSVMFTTFTAYILVRIWALKSIAGDGYLEINENLSKISLLLTNLIKLTGRNFTPPFINTSYALLFFAISVMVYAAIVFSIFKKNKQWGLFAIVLWVAMISGVATAAPLGIDTHYNESERYLYYSSFFYCFFLALAIGVLLKHRYRMVISLLVMLVFIILFAGLQRNYQTASAITRATVNMVSNNSDYNNAYFIDVPKKYKGSMIFRISLPEAIRWIVPQATYKNIIIVSQVESPPGKLPFKTGIADWKELAAAKCWSDSIPIISTPSFTSRIHANDIIFWYRGDGLYKVTMR